MLTPISSQSHAGDLSEKDREVIKLSSKKWVDTYNRNDWKALASLFTPNAVMMPPNHTEVVGRNAIASWEANNENGFRIAFDIQHIGGNDNTAYVRGHSCVFIPDGAGGFGVDFGKFLEIRKKQADGTWLIENDIFNSDAPVGSELLASCPFAH